MISLDILDAGLTEGAFDEVGVPDPAVVLGGKARWEGTVFWAAVVVKQVRARVVAVSGGITSRSRWEESQPITLIVCARAPDQSSRTTCWPTVVIRWGLVSRAFAFSAIRSTTPNRSVTAAIRAGNSAAGSRVRGHQLPSTTPRAVGDGGNTSCEFWA